jgi:hypothetical protein
VRKDAPVSHAKKWVNCGTKLLNLPRKGCKIGSCVRRGDMMIYYRVPNTKLICSKQEDQLFQARR